MDSNAHLLAEHLSEQNGVEVFVTENATPQTPHPDLKGKIQILPLPEVKSKVVPSAIKALHKYNKQYQFEVTYSSRSSALSNLLLATFGQKRIRHIAYRGTGAKIRKWDPTYYLGILNPAVSHVVCETEHIKCYLLNFFPSEKLSVHPKPYHLSWVEDALAHPQKTPLKTTSVMRIVMVGNTAGRPYKGLRFLMKALQHLNNPSLHFTFIGDYDQEDQDLALSSSPSSFSFLGPRPSEEALRYISGADCLVLPSLRDASPRVLREAMALKKATIVINIEGAKDLVIPEVTSLMVPHANIATLADAIQWMKEHPYKRAEMGRAGREHIENTFSSDKWLKAITPIFLRFGYQR